MHAAINRFYTRIIKSLGSTHLLLTVLAIRATQLHVIFIPMCIRREKNRVVHAKSEEKLKKEDDEAKKKLCKREGKRGRGKEVVYSYAGWNKEKRRLLCEERGRKTGPASCS